MSYFEAIELAKGLIDNLGKDYPFLKDWRIKLDSAKRRAGACKPVVKEITISRHHIEHNSFLIVKDTILHEIAHAINYELNKDISHGPNWKTIAKLIGATPKATGLFDIPEAPWLLVSVCSKTKTLKLIARRYRRRKNIRNFHLKGKPETLGSLYYLSNEDYSLYKKELKSFNELTFFQ
ncbi:SprT-like domain-containing protein [Aliikangiella sp. G2MR2-5]|uniref:SprT-like domain-containing protein n=1 Tax=Aliikangiella sp. G2MR2-5 TaxID=2788943 RepID=UPI0018AA52AF|nr:SprT-like domain-containing protein [Aliikangiella sp. G2MR2-5]